MIYGKKPLRMFTDKNTLRNYAKLRHELHKYQESHNPMSYDYEYVGLVGEDYLGAYLGLPLDSRLKEGGDKGIDYTISLGTLDAKTLRYTQRGLFVVYKEVLTYPLANIFVLINCRRGDDKCHFIGWAYDKEVLSAKHYKYPRDTENWIIPKRDLHPMQEFWEIVNSSVGLETRVYNQPQLI